MGTGSVDALDASATSVQSIELTASVGVERYYGACVASVDGESNTDNNCSSAVKITVSGQETVVIPDANLRAAIAKRLGKARGAPISVAEMKTLTRLEAGNSGISDLTGLDFATNLTRLDLRGNRDITDISALAGLTKLTELNLSDNNDITAITPLAGLTNLTWLGLQRIFIEDIAALAGLTNLTWLDLQYNYHISDIAALSRLTSLTDLYLQANNISDIAAIAGLTNLVVLNGSHNEITDLSALSGLTELREVLLSDNNISDLSPLGANMGLGGGDLVNVGTNPLNTTATDTHIPALQARGVRVVFDEVVVFAGPQVYNDNLFVLPVTENLAVGTGRLPLRSYAARFYEHFSDEFDFLVFVPNLDAGDFEPQASPNTHVYVSVRNDVRGIGSSLYSDGRWGSAENLQGVILFGSFGSSDYPARRTTLKYGPMLHELMHRWANYFLIPSQDWRYGAHWGCSSANGRLGGFDIADLVDHGGGRYTAPSVAPGGRSDNDGPYSPIELYLAGFVPPEEVPDLWIAEDGEILTDAEGYLLKADNGDWIFTGNRIRTYEIEDIIAEHGPRVPDYSRSQKDFTAAVILLISEEFPATRTNLEALSADVSWFSHPGVDQVDYKYNFYEATGGRGTITMDGLSQLKRRGSAKRVVPKSFGTPPPPIVDYWE